MIVKPMKLNSKYIIMKTPIITYDFAVSFKTSNQISPDDFKVLTPTLKVNPETTIGEIYAWYKNKEGNTKPMDVSLTQMEMFI